MRLEQNTTNSQLAQKLAVQTQIHLPGTVGRLLKQIRDLEQVAPLFIAAGLTRTIERPNPLNLNVSGIATRYSTGRILGGYLYAAAALQIQLDINMNTVRTAGQSSICSIDDIGFESQAKHLELITIQQAYQVAAGLMRDEVFPKLLLFDCPLVLNRSMAPLTDDPSYEDYKNVYLQTVECIENFWKEYQHRLFPWNREGCVLASVLSGKDGAIIHSALQVVQKGLSSSGVLTLENIDKNELKNLKSKIQPISRIGKERLLYGILDRYTRTAAFRMSEYMPRMEPKSIVEKGILGFHFKSGSGSRPLLLQLVGDEPDWTQKDLDKVAGQVMALTVVGGPQAIPFPIQLASQELKVLDGFLDFYIRQVGQEMKTGEIEELWLGDLMKMEEMS